MTIVVIWRYINKTELNWIVWDAGAEVDGWEEDQPCVLDAGAEVGGWEEDQPCVWDAGAEVDGWEEDQPCVWDANRDITPAQYESGFPVFVISIENREIEKKCNYLATAIVGYKDQLKSRKC